ncbi:uncharacterized protein [Temnothorax nylanderi]|uniref:uncharacterized protein n=1 Tax=Temnothorax nylanderi TaxID=102681 RepID=UPI003A8A3E3A
MVHKFWEIEELPSRKILSPEEEECEKHFQRTIQRLPSGHYSVGLPFNDQKEKLGESYGTALRRFLELEKRLIKDPKLYEEYRKFLNEYEALGHMTQVEDPNLKNGYFLPHHAVVKESSTTTKVRVVFNASAKTTTGVSLNDVLLTGLVDQDLFSIVMRFRLHPIVITADIEKMYRQVYIHKEDRKYQRIIWRNKPEEPLQIKELNTVTQGMTSAPYQATSSIKQLSKDEAKRYPEVSKIIIEDIYVDDVLTGAKTVEQAKILKKQLTDLLSSGGFHLRKWASNHPHLEEQETDNGAEEHINLDSQNIQKTLGIFWNPHQDCFLYRITIQPIEDKVTKRSILSQIASLYDPLGLLGPVFVKAKILLQALWKLQLTWDEAVPEEIYTAWKTFQDQKGELNNITFPRQVCIAQYESLQLHGFADASETAYGACLYIRSSNDQQSHVVLVCSKSRVAPLKRLTLARLELSAALLLKQLCETALNAFINITYERIILWLDATIALHWIHTQPHRLKTFVANRVAAIQEIKFQVEWRHIASRDNSADLVSRGVLPSDLVDNALWINGPGWLKEDESNWPNSFPTMTEIPEQRTTISLKTEQSFDLLRQFSSFTMLRRVVAWCLRFINNCRTKDKIEGSLSSIELTRAMTSIIKLVQIESFAIEIHRLETGRPLKQNSNLMSLHPILDSNGVMRVGGRLMHADLTYEQKHQIILPGKHHVTDLIIRDAHITQLHAGPQATLYCIRQKFWPVRGKSRIRKIVHECMTCFKAKPKMVEYEMGNLSKDRFESTRPFSNSGIDYCGPFWIKEKKQRNRNKVKVYVSIFVCLSTKAVHLELVSGLTTEEFIAALKRFFSRRGKANLMLSDNATNFVGARNELRELYDFVNTQAHKEGTTRWLSEQEVSWKFIPPRAPHFGGIWEAAVRSFKHHLYRISKNTLLTFEQFNTLIIEIEAVLNSRPLTPLSSEPDDLNVLTPSHFLIGGLLSSVPEVDFTDTPSNRLSQSMATYSKVETRLLESMEQRISY